MAKAMAAASKSNEKWRRGENNGEEGINGENKRK